MLNLINQLRLGNPWKYKAPIILCWPYMLIRLTGMSPAFSFWLTLAAYATFFGIAGLGYLMNDWADISADKKANKPNKIGELRVGWRILILIVLLSFAFVPWIWLNTSKWTFILIGTELFLFILYSVPPVRLKEKGMAGVITDGLYAFIVPSVLAAYTFYLAGNWNYKNFHFFVFVICAWLMITGIRGILLHQLKDHYNDLKSGASTFVIKKGIRITETIIRNLLPIELILFSGFFVFVFNEFYLLFPVYIVFFLVRLYQERKLKEEVSFKNYARFSFRFLDEFYLDWLPVIILSHLCMYHYGFFTLLGIHLILFRNPVKKLIKNRLGK